MREGLEMSVGNHFHHVLTFLDQAAQAQGVSLPGESGSLFDHRILDSFGLLEFIGFLEDTFIIKIPDEDLAPDRFATIEKIREYIGSRVER